VCTGTPQPLLYWVAPTLAHGCSGQGKRWCCQGQAHIVRLDVGRTSWLDVIIMHSRIKHNVLYLVWKMFWTIPPLQALLASSNSSTSARDSAHPKAPKTSTTCAMSRAPGMGMVPFAMHQLTATYRHTQ
jgi:hypothetical protein